MLNGVCQSIKMQFHAKIQGLCSISCPEGHVWLMVISISMTPVHCIAMPVCQCSNCEWLQTIIWYLQFLPKNIYISEDWTQSRIILSNYCVKTLIQSLRGHLNCKNRWGSAFWWRGQKISARSWNCWDFFNWGRP